jgi:hypothetical protein
LIAKDVRMEDSQHTQDDTFRQSRKKQLKLA